LAGEHRDHFHRDAAACHLRDPSKRERHLALFLKMADFIIGLSNASTA
jgi:hypothetical protein